MATGSDGRESGVSDEETPPPRPPARVPKEARSACEEHRAWIEDQVQLGRNAQSIYQDLVEGFGFTHRYNSVKRFVRTLKRREPERFDVSRVLPERRPRSISARAHRRSIATASTADRICFA